MSIDYSEINSRAVDLLLSVKKHTSTIEDPLKALVELRVSQINGCSYCIELHSNEARKAGESDQRLDCLAAWKEGLLFSDREMAALSWAEFITNISTETDREGKLQALLEHYSDTEAVDLTLIVSLMNCMNRLSIAFGDEPIQRNT